MSLKMQVHQNSKKVLILRLSSLGDIVLATAALERFPANERVDWLIAKEYSPILRGHPRIETLWEFDRATGLWGWYRLCHSLWKQNYDEVLDLHRSLRTFLLRAIFSLCRIFTKNRKKLGPSWRTLSKQRLRLYALFLLKKILPSKLRPTPLVHRFSAFFNDSKEPRGRPNLSHLLTESPKPGTADRISEDWMNQKYICIMPSSVWEGKRWPVVRYLKTIKDLSYMAVILGDKRDSASFELVSLLEKDSIPHVSGVGKWDLVQVAQVLARSAGYLGNDTGLAHMAEAVGVPAYVIFGPTHPDMGFGPWRSESKSTTSPLWCSPCGKDGRFCFRLTDRYACLRRISPENIIQMIPK